ncbi:Bifunctional xylanase/deacetylase [Patescibacteria group bacterium]|nr:Bifunctional xylanase/deacetylase [Patescibacteria group bacterium]
MPHWRLFILGCLFIHSVHAAGPQVVAKMNQTIWQQPINSIESFNQASRATILVYASELKTMSAMNDAAMKSEFKIKTIDRTSVNTWLAKEQNLIVKNYQNAAQTCQSNDWTCIKADHFDELVNQTAQLNIPASLLSWQSTIKPFAHHYLAEQLRLAALFPKVSSEIMTFNANEWTGDELPDRQFLLTFDDGPSPTHGDTDATIAMLNSQHKTAVFFVLGENWQARQHKTNDLIHLYQGQCVALHGFKHESHAKWAKWQDSIIRTQSLVKQTDSTLFTPLFRPPYGQRKADSGAFFQQQGLQVALWNLDSQDWNNKVNSDDVLNRMLTLMLIKRHGVLLFHDIHGKAKTALPVLFAKLGDAVQWQDCHH